VTAEKGTGIPPERWAPTQDGEEIVKKHFQFLIAEYSFPKHLQRPLDQDLLETIVKEKARALKTHGALLLKS